MSSSTYKSIGRGGGNIHLLATSGEIGRKFEEALIGEETIRLITTPIALREDIKEPKAKGLRKVIKKIREL